MQHCATFSYVFGDIAASTSLPFNLCLQSTKPCINDRLFEVLKLIYDTLAMNGVLD